jgi:hypothetical protein
MTRLEFIQDSLLSLIAMSTLKDLKKLTDNLAESETKTAGAFRGSW